MEIYLFRNRCSKISLQNNFNTTELLNQIGGSSNVKSILHRWTGEIVYLSIEYH